MAINYAAIADAGGIEKPTYRPRHSRRLDDRESVKVRARSGGRCEIDVVGEGRCFRRADHVHHMIGGWKRRARGESALAIRKQHACAPCHLDITGRLGGKRLIRVGGAMPHHADSYRRVSGR